MRKKLPARKRQTEAFFGMQHFVDVVVRHGKQVKSQQGQREIVKVNAGAVIFVFHGAQSDERKKEEKEERGDRFFDLRERLKPSISVTRMQSTCSAIHIIH